MVNRVQGKGGSLKYCLSAARLSARPLPLRVLDAVISVVRIWNEQEGGLLND